MTELDRLLRDLGHPRVPLEFAVLLGCLALAWGLSWLAGRHRRGESVWFGRFTVDGLLFPLLALAFCWGARAAFMAQDTAPTPLLRLAVPILISLAGIRFLARVLTVVFPASPFARLVERLFSWLAWIAAVLWILGLLPQVMDQMDDVRFAFGKSHVSLLAIVQALLSSGAVMVLVLWISAALERHVLAETLEDLSLRKVAGNALRALLLVVGLLFALSAVGVDLTALSVLGGALGVGLGFGLQKLASNYVSGFVILFERSLRIGDTVKVDNFEGVVTDIKTRYTLIRALNGREAIVPNEKVITERVENLSLADTRVLISTDVTVGYESDTAQVQALLREAALSAPRVLRDPAPAPHLVSLAADGLAFTLYFWIADPANGQANVKSEVNLAVLKALRAAGIDIPYPQRVLRIVPPGAGAGADPVAGAGAEAGAGAAPGDVPGDPAARPGAPQPAERPSPR